jgi:hypothetical protein
MKFIALCISVFFLFTHSVFANEFVLNCTLIDSTIYNDPDNEWETIDNSHIAGMKDKFIFDTVNKSVYFMNFLEKEWDVLFTKYTLFFSKNILDDEGLGDANYTLDSKSYNFNFGTKILIRTMGYTHDVSPRGNFKKSERFHFIYNCN